MCADILQALLGSDSHFLLVIVTVAPFSSGEQTEPLSPVTSYHILLSILIILTFFFLISNSI